MLRIRFRANPTDPRPIHWPAKYPFWIMGYDSAGAFAIVVSYADSTDYIYANWPEAEDLDVEECQEYAFTDRFPIPDWFKEKPHAT